MNRSCRKRCTEEASDGTYRIKIRIYWIWLGASDIAAACQNEEFCLECMKGDEIYEIDVTKNVDGFCQSLQEIHIDKWNCRHFEGFVSLFPDFSWNLSVTTSEIHVACDGRDIFPPNWSEFCDLLHRLGLSELKDSFF